MTTFPVKENHWCGQSLHEQVQIPARLEATILDVILEHKRQQSKSGKASFRITSKKLTVSYHCYMLVVCSLCRKTETYSLEWSIHVRYLISGSYLTLCHLIIIKIYIQSSICTQSPTLNLNHRFCLFLHANYLLINVIKLYSYEVIYRHKLS